jgi:CheY-like chemotaxis protein
MVRNVFRRWLERAGMIVVEASSAVEAYVVLEDEAAFDVVLTDLNMPGLTGRELIEWVRARLPLLPIVVISAYPEALLGVEADQMLAKPVTGRQIEAAATGAGRLRPSPLLRNHRPRLRTKSRCG